METIKTLYYMCHLASGGPLLLQALMPSVAKAGVSIVLFYYHIMYSVHDYIIYNIMII